MGHPATSPWTTMNFAQREAALLVEMSRAPQAEQRRLVAELDALRAQHAASIKADRDLDLASATVAERMTPVLAYSHHTSDTDWLVEVPTSAPSRTKRRSAASPGAASARTRQANAARAGIEGGIAEPPASGEA